MSAVMPLIRINDQLSINLFNVVSVVRVHGAVTIHYTNREMSTLMDDDARLFLEYFDGASEDIRTALRVPTHTEPAADSEVITDRDWGALSREAPRDEGTDTPAE